MPRPSPNRAPPGDPADLQREERRGAHCRGQKGQQFDPQLPGAESQTEAGRPDADLVEVVGKAAKALENDPDAGLALEALPELIDQLEAKIGGKKLDFEEAAKMRDRVKQLPEDGEIALIRDSKASIRFELTKGTSVVHHRHVAEILPADTLRM